MQLQFPTGEIFTVRAALSASQINHPLKSFYDRLITARKLARSARTAMIPNLIILMTHWQKNPPISLAHKTPLPG